MPRKVTLTFSDGTTHIYDNVPDNATPDQVQARAGKDFAGKTITNIDGGKTKGVVEHAKDFGKATASLADTGLNLITGGIDTLAYPLARAYYGTVGGMNAQDAANKAQQETTSPKDMVGSALGITQDPAYQNEASRRALHGVGQAVQPIVEPIIKGGAQLTGLPEQDISSMVNLGTMAVAGPAGRAVGRGAQATGQAVKQGAGFAKGVAQGMAEMGEGNYRTPTSAVSPEVLQAAKVGPNQQQVIQPGMAGRQLGNDIINTKVNPLAVAADVMGGGGVVTAASKAKSAINAVRDINQSRRQTAAGITSHEPIPPEQVPPPVAPTSGIPQPVNPDQMPKPKNAMDSGFAQELQDLSKGTPNGAVNPLQLEWNGKPQAPVEQPPMYVTPGGTATPNMALAEKAGINERIGQNVFPEAPASNLPQQSPSLFNPERPAVPEAPTAREVANQAKINKFEKATAVAEGEAVADTMPQVQQAKNAMVEANPELQRYTNSYVKPAEIEYNVNQFLNGQSKDTLVTGGPGTGKSMLTGQYLKANPDAHIEVLSKNSMSEAHTLKKIEQAVSLNEKVLLVLDEVDSFTSAQLEKLRPFTESKNVKTLYTSNYLDKVPEGIRNRATNKIDMNTKLTPEQKEVFALSTAERYNINKTPAEIKAVAEKSNSFRDISNNMLEGKNWKQEGMWGPSWTKEEVATLPLKPETQQLLENFASNNTSKNLVIIEKSVYDKNPEFSSNLDKLLPTSTMESVIGGMGSPNSGSPTFRVIIESTSDYNKLKALKSEIEQNNMSVTPTKLIVEDKLGFAEEALQSRAYSITGKDLVESNTSKNPAVAPVQPSSLFVPKEPQQAVSLEKKTGMSSQQILENIRNRKKD